MKPLIYLSLCLLLTMSETDCSEQRSKSAEPRINGLRPTIDPSIIIPRLDMNKIREIDQRMKEDEIGFFADARAKISQPDLIQQYPGQSYLSMAKNVIILGFICALIGDVYIEYRAKALQAPASDQRR